jgi:DNA ligase-1
MRLSDVVAASRSVAESSARTDKIRHLAACLRRAEPEAVETAVALLSGEPRQGRIGLGPAALRAAMPPTAAPAPVLTLAEVDAALDRIARTRGAGSAAERARLTRELLARSTADEQDFLLRAVLGELRQGAVEGLMVEAVALAAQLPIDEIRRALMVSGNLGAVARAALSEGRPALAGIAVRLFRPLQPMLAKTAEDPSEALGKLGEAGFEDKLDGARIQLHKEEYPAAALLLRLPLYRRQRHSRPSGRGAVCGTRRRGAGAVPDPAARDGGVGRGRGVSRRGARRRP